MDDIVGDRTAAINLDQVEPQEQSKSAQKKAAKQKKLAEEKANKSATNTTRDARASAKKVGNLTSKGRREGAALIGIDVAKEDDFSGWYAQVLTKGDMLDYYDISGCYILKVVRS